MKALRAAWHPVVFSQELASEPVAATLLDTPLVIWRDSNGTPHASSDICVHRGTALSGGCVKGDNIMCPYHGWQYDATGTCVHIPQLEDPSRVPPKAKVPAYQCVERNDMVWIALDTPRFEIPRIDEIDDANWRWVNCGPYDWNAGSSRQLENFTDFGHFPWVHPGLLGDPDRPVVPDCDVSTTGHVVHYNIVRPEAPNSDDFPIFANADTTAPMRTSRYEIHAPFTLLLRLGWGGVKGMIYFFVSQPIDKDHSRGFLTIGCNYNFDQPDSVIRDFEDVIFNQDKVIVESQRPKSVPFDITSELHMKFDGVALAYRKMMTANGFAE